MSYKDKYLKYKKKYIELKNNMHGGNKPQSIIIVGTGPTGLFTAIFVQVFLLNVINIKPNIIIYGNRTEDVGRLRQVIILKKEYNMIDKLFEIDGLVEFMSNYIECVLYDDTPDDKPNTDYAVGPLLCNNTDLFKDKATFFSNKNIKGITITIYNLELCLINFIKEKYKNIEFVYETFNIDNFNIKDVIILGCTGGKGDIRIKYKNFLSIDNLKKQYSCLNSYKLNFDEKTKLYENYYAGTEKDAYMLILRYPVLNKKKHNDISFAHPLLSSSSDKIDNIMITNYINKYNGAKYITDRELSIMKDDNTLFYRQLYYLIDLNTFKELSDCGFWNFCSLEDFFSNRISVEQIIPSKNEKIFNLPIHIEHTLDKKIIKTLTSGDNKKVIEINPITHITKLSFLLRQVEIFSTKDLLEILKPGQKFIIKKGKIERPYIDIDELNDITFTVQSIHIIGYSNRVFDELYFQLIPVENIDIKIEPNEILYIYKTEFKPEQLKKHKHIIDKIKTDILRFDNTIKINDIDLLKYSELVRIWTSVRFSNKIYENINGIKTAIVGDETILVNPMTGRGVSNSILSSYYLIQELCTDKYNNIIDLIKVFDTKCEEFQRKIFYPNLCNILEQGENVLNEQYIRHSFI